MIDRVTSGILIAFIATVLLSSAVYAVGEKDQGASSIDGIREGEYGIIEGEILNVFEARIRVSVAGETRDLPVGEQPKIMMNGHPALLQALRPVADDCYFIGRIWLDRMGVVQRIEGDYRGASVLILDIKRLKNGGARLVVENPEEAGQPKRRFETTSDCRGIEAALSGGKLVEAYILFDLHGKVRGIFF